MSTIRWWYESLEWKKKPKMTIQGGAGRRKREKNVQTESGIEDLLPQRFSASKNISTEFWYLMHFSRTSLTNLGLGFSGSTAKQSDLGEGGADKWHSQPGRRHKMKLLCPGRPAAVPHQSSQLHRNWKLLKW